MTHESRLDLALRTLLTECRVAALGTCTDEGDPFVSQVPYAIDPDGPSLVILVSGLAAHARHLAARPQASLLVAEPEVAGAPVHGLARVTLQLSAERLAPDSAAAVRARALYLNRFPEAEPLTGMTDFRWVGLHPRSARHVGGLGAARSLDEATLRAVLQRVGRDAATTGDAAAPLSLAADGWQAAPDAPPEPVTAEAGSEAEVAGAAEPESDALWLERHAEWLAREALNRVNPAQPRLVTLLQLGAQRSRVVFGDDRTPARVLPWPVGVQGVAEAFFRHDPPRPIELEEAIATVEDTLMRLVPQLPIGSRLCVVADPTLQHIAELAGAPGPWLSLEAVERLFNRLCRVAEGRPAAQEGWPGGRALAAGVLVVREFMHHLAFDSAQLTR